MKISKIEIIKALISELQHYERKCIMYDLLDDSIEEPNIENQKNDKFAK